MAELGFPVLGVDTDAAKVARLSAGEVPFFEPGLEELLRKNLERGRLRFTASVPEAARWGDVHFVCVGTPQQRGSAAADLTYLEAATDALARDVRAGALVVGKSTVPAGTAAQIAAKMDAAGALLAWNPEFLREGFAVDDTLRPDRLVFGLPAGAGREAAEALLRRVYASLLDSGVPVVVTDYTTAELVKTSANAFLATKISFINAIAEVCEATGADISHLSAALAYDDRIGARYLHAGLGFGGGCLPKDIRAFRARAEELGVGSSLRFLAEVDAINARRRARIVALTKELLDGTFDDRRVAVLGAAFKPNSDDIRDSPALEVSAAIHDLGAQVTVYDPAAIGNAAAAYPQLAYATSPTEAARGANAVLHLTEWREFRDMDPAVLARVVTNRIVVDGRNSLDSDRWTAAGWTYRALGRPPGAR